MLFLPEPPATLAPEAGAGLAATGLGNPITAVLISYRSFDTMLEKIVLVLALTGVWSVAADDAWGRAPAPIGRMAPDGAMILLTQTLAPLGILVGLHIFWVGADAPGGAFQGGALLAAMWMIVMMARLTEAPRIDARWLRLALIAGPAVFFVAGRRGRRVGRRLLFLSAGLRQADHPVHRGLHAADHRGHPADAGRGTAKPGAGR